MARGTQELIERLLQTSISADLRLELQEFSAAAAAGTLAPDDRRYIEALGQRLLGIARPEPAQDGEASGLAADLWSEEDPETRRWRERAEKAEARVAELEAELAALKG